MDKKLFQKAKANNLEYFQIMKTLVEEINIETLNDKQEKFETMSLEQYLVSAIYKGKKVQIYTEYLENSIIDLLKQQAEYLEEETEIFEPKLEDIQDNTDLEMDNPDKIVTQLLELNKLREKYPQVKEINTCYSENITERTIYTENKTLTDKKKLKSFGLEIFASDKEKTSSCYDTAIKIGNDNIEIEEFCEQSIQNAIDKLYYQEIEDGTYQVILSSKVMAKILDKFIPLFSADRIQKGTSLLIDKQNKQVFSSKITMIEDPNNPQKIGKRLFDDAGTKTYLKKIIENGVFKESLYDQKTASIDKRESTGNDYGEINVRNLSIEPGEKSIEALIASLDEGILIDTVNGLHAGINQTNGNISLQAEGYYIKKGKKEYASKLFVLSTNIMDILNNVIELSNHIDFCLATTASPDILVENIKISK